jgi:formylglycine-generating enzyme required for sulfatase activity
MTFATYWATFRNRKESPMIARFLVVISVILLASGVNAGGDKKDDKDALQGERTQPAKPKDGPLGMKFVSLPKATFSMGWDGTKGSAKETKIKEDFEIAIHTVTQGQWQEVMGKNPSFFSRDGGGKDKVDRRQLTFPISDN